MFALNLIAKVMDWDDIEATREYAWLRLMAAVKYDGYSDFAAGAGFLEALVDWLHQFEPQSRRIAYEFVKTRLVYISSAEMQRVIEAFLPEVVTPYLRRCVAEESGIEAHEVWATAEHAKAFSNRLRRCLFVGMSDGSRIDILRRSNAGKLSQEQVIPMMNVDNEKWRSLGDDLKEEQGADALFQDVFLIDDFTASGTTFVRTDKVGRAKGKLPKFEKIIQDAKAALGGSFPIADGFRLHIHHYISTTQARNALEERVAAVASVMENRSFDAEFLSAEGLTEGLLLGPELPLGFIDTEIVPTGNVEEGSVGLKGNCPADVPVIKLCESAYDPVLFKRLEKHCKEANMTTMCYGYGYCALPLVLEHNTPNNSVPLIWSETGSQTDPLMRPLFHRRDRHG
ncbi:hypothetical protein [uncultured Roseobacter sp.]|uniref:phosphoribosyltransferase-like protein n=1 Tax=uncultured Roseobacter sp. TaxID=114847 RepID=UPI0026045D02|nr:hypothetical protein [uncultured Roseobacter sp.]